jgi:hypothetical protein
LHDVEFGQGNNGFGQGGVGGAVGDHHDARTDPLAAFADDALLANLGDADFTLGRSC